MKKLILIFLVLGSINLVAQDKKKLVGPDAKNYKPWQHKKTTTLFSFYKIAQPKMFGADFKNQKIWNKVISDEKFVITTNNKRRNLQGPKAKNYKPWQK